jgi:hypothetical protein
LYNDILKAIVDEITNNDDSMTKPTRVQVSSKLALKYLDIPPDEMRGD